jgi:hypothetical protein
MRFSIFKVILVMTIASMLLVGKGRPVAAQEKAPDLRMLLNLDLFDAQSADSSAVAPTDADSAGMGLSMLDQIRALNAMGYLGDTPGAQPPVMLAPAGGGGVPPNPRDDGEVPLL